MSLLQGSPLLAVATFSLLVRRVTGRTFPIIQRQPCFCPPNTDKGPQAVATPKEGAPKLKSDGGLPVGPGDPSPLLEEQRANSLTPACKAKKLYWGYSERREPNSAANKRRKEDQRWLLLFNSFEVVPLLSRGSTRLRSPRAQRVELAVLGDMAMLLPGFAIIQGCLLPWETAWLKQLVHFLGCRASPDVLVLMALKYHFTASSARLKEQSMIGKWKPPCHSHMVLGLSWRIFHGEEYG